MRFSGILVFLISVFLAGCIVAGQEKREEQPDLKSIEELDTQSKYMPKPIDWENYDKTPKISTKEVYVLKGPKVGYLVTYAYPVRNDYQGLELREVHTVYNAAFERIGFFTPNGDTREYLITKSGFVTFVDKGRHNHERAIKTLLNIDLDKVVVFKPIDYPWILSSRYPEPPEELPVSPEPEN